MPSVEFRLELYEKKQKKLINLGYKITKLFKPETFKYPKENIA